MLAFGGQRHYAGTFRLTPVLAYRMWNHEYRIADATDGG